MSYTHQGDTYGSNFGLRNYQPVNQLTLCNTTQAPKAAYIPMRFWFCKNPGLAVPLIALQYHEVKFNVTFANVSKFIYCPDNTQQVSLESVKVYADYVYLDTTERRQFAQNAHEYLIDQLQHQQESGSDNTKNTYRLNFNHPVKELIWTGRPVDVVLNTSYLEGNITGGATPSSIVKNQTGLTTDMMDQPPITAPTSNLFSKIILNGTDRFTERHITYFTRNQIWDNHTGFGSTGSNICFNYNRDAIGVYSFALRPEEHQPSGTCNFSRIDTAQLLFDGEPLNPLDIYAVNYNVLRIMSGMGGLAYSN
jgi:hypothetical protein